MKEHLLNTLENSRNYTLAVAEAMPEKDYAFKPSPAIWNFLEQVHHIAYGIGWWQENFIKGNKTDWSPTTTKKNKKEAIEYLDSAFDSLKNTVTNTAISDELAKGVGATLDHITHHRGQAIIYLRSKGIEAPEYIY